MKQVMAVVALAALMAVPAMGAWAENFDSYPLNSAVVGQGGWAGWDGGAAQAVVSDLHAKYAGDKAAKLYSPGIPDGTGADDLVHEYSGYTSGQYQYTAWQYIPTPATGSTLKTYFIMMNKYTAGNASKGWSVQMKFDYATGLVTDDESATKPGVPIVYDAWKEIKVLIDLEANTQTTYYNGTQVGTADWYNPADANHAKSIAAVDLWADSGGNGVCYDNISLVPEPASLCLIALGGLLLRRRR